MLAHGDPYAIRVSRHGPRRALTAEQIEMAVLARRQGVPVKQMAEHFGVTDVTIYKFTKGWNK